VLACAAFVGLANTDLRGQSPAEPLRSPVLLEQGIPMEVLADLPSSDNLPSLLGAVLPELVPDRLDTGGISTGESTRLGAHGSTWTQTQYRLGDVDITDPDGSGTPFFVPGVLEWQRVSVVSGLKGIDVNAAGPAVFLVPRDPSATWMRRVEGSFGPSAFSAGNSFSTPPAIQRSDSWKRAHLLASGPLLPDRLGLAVSGSWMESSRFDRSDPKSVVADQASLFAYLLYTPAPRATVRTIAYGQRADFPSPNRLVLQQRGAVERDRSVHVQSTFERLGDGISWRVFGAYSSRDRASQVQFTGPLVMERLTGGPVSELLYPSAGAAPPGVNRRLSAGGRVALRPFSFFGRMHAATIGLDVTGTRARVGEPFEARVGELVDGMAARVWDFSGWRTPSRWNGSTFAAFAGDRFEILERVLVDVGLRFERVAGSSEGGAQGVSWHDLYPRVSARWQPTSSPRLSLFSSFGRYGFSLPLRWLAVGDSSAPVASVYRWVATTGFRPPLPSEIGPLVARVGPGTGGEPGFAAIDPNLERPRFDELVVGVESRRGPATIVRLAGIGRWEKQNVALTNPGVPDSSYSVTSVRDGGIAGLDLLLPAYDRDPATFGADRYLLTNPAGGVAKAFGLDLTVQTRTERLFLLAGGTAGYFEGVPANRGFLLTENDRGLIGETFTSPNARTYSTKNRPFTDRGYTLKISGVYQFPREVRLGAIARYQDGQPFARHVVFPGLRQGPEAVRAFDNGGTRFKFTLTVDARLQKGIRLGDDRVDILLDGFNLLNKGDEIEESQVDGATWRHITAVQPPRALHAGVRVTF
jgi:hypothetical protein